MRLTIFGHGNANGQDFGSDWVDLNTLPGFRGQLSRIRPFFARGPLPILLWLAQQTQGIPADGATVILGGCMVGRNSPLLQALSDIFGVPVVAWTATQHPLLPGHQGGMKVCSPKKCDYMGRTLLDLIEGTPPQ
jgi:hypothetical protein